MTKLILITGLLSTTIFSFAQKYKRQELKTIIYAGVYSFGKSAEDGGGMITVYPETDSTILFYIDICRGAPSYNLGQLYSRLKIKNGFGIYYLKMEYAETACNWEVTINNKEFSIKNVKDYRGCPFGNGVDAENIYKRKGNTKPEYFIDGHGHKIFFNKTSPENYLN